MANGKSNRWVTPSNVEEVEDVPVEDLVADNETHEAITRNEARKRVKQWVKGLTGRILWEEVFTILRARLNLTDTEMAEAIDAANHDERLKWAENNITIGAAKLFDPNVQGSTLNQKKAWAATVLAGRTFTNENRQGLMDWLVKKANSVTLEESMALITGVMGAWEAVPIAEPPPTEPIETPAEPTAEPTGKP
jgi:hypothetical protein